MRKWCNIGRHCKWRLQAEITGWKETNEIGRSIQDTDMVSIQLTRPKWRWNCIINLIDPRDWDDWAICCLLGSNCISKRLAKERWYPPSVYSKWNPTRHIGLHKPRPSEENPTENLMCPFLNKAILYQTHSKNEPRITMIRPMIIFSTRFRRWNWLMRSKSWLEERILYIPQL